MEETVAPSPWPLLRRMVRRHRRRLVPGYLLIGVWQLCETSVPVVIGLVVDRGVATGDVSGLVPTMLLLVAVMSTLAFSYRFGSRLVIRALQEESHALRLEIAGHVLHPRGVRSRALPGEVLFLATSDAQRVALVVHLLGFALAAVAGVLVVAVYVLSVDPLVGLLILVGVPAVALVIQLVTPVVARRSERQQESIARSSGLATDLLHGLRPLKGVGGEDTGLARYRTTSRDAQHDTIAVARSWGALEGLTTLLSGALLAAVALVAGVRAVHGDLTLGELIALVGLTQFLAEPIRQLGETSAEFGGSLASARRIATFLASPRRQAAADGRLPDGPAALALRDVHAGPVRGLDLVIGPHEVVAVVVDDPAVADTLLELLQAEAVPDRGRVELGDRPLHELHVDSRRAHVLVSPHSAQVPAGTLGATIDPDGSLTAEQRDAVLSASAADDVVALHPDGLDRLVSERGASLSGGQRQRIALARALAVDAPLLVLHDPTTAIDSVTEQSVAAGLRSLRAGRGTLVLTSSPALLQAADRVVVVRDGAVAATGTHQALLVDADYRDAVLR